jgi:hypothetical protein
MVCKIAKIECYVFSLSVSVAQTNIRDSFPSKNIIAINIFSMKCVCSIVIIVMIFVRFSISPISVQTDNCGAFRFFSLLHLSPI